MRAQPRRMAREYLVRRRHFEHGVDVFVIVVHCQQLQNDAFYTGDGNHEKGREHFAVAIHLPAGSLFGT
jgi:hypothetical protein